MSEMRGCLLLVSFAMIAAFCSGCIATILRKLGSDRIEPNLAMSMPLGIGCSLLLLRLIDSGKRKNPKK
jgi:uncharacterized membrane protein